LPHAEREHLIADLRRRVGALDGGGARHRPSLPFGVPALDRHLPGGLKLGALHEVCEAGAASDYAALATLFTAAILARLPGPALWCLKGCDLFAPALSGVGLTPDRLLFVETWRDTDVLPAMEEGLRQRGPAAVVGEVARLSLIASRRLQLASERARRPCARHPAPALCGRTLNRTVRGDHALAGVARALASAPEPGLKSGALAGRPSPRQGRGGSLLDRGST
jgi:protein ImuA